MNPTEQPWQQELATIEAEIDSLKRRREVQQAELHRLQESDTTVLDASETTRPYRANFLFCKLDETEQRLCNLELRRQVLALKKSGEPVRSYTKFE
ncbi:MAG: hypothetical protein U1F76_25505 [Candidatus Competibacteraceae bacterium]